MPRKSKLSRQEAANNPEIDGVGAADSGSQTITLSSRTSIRDLICPFNIDTRDLNHIKFLFKVPKYVRSFFIVTLPRFLKFGEFLRPLYNFGNINTSVFISPIDNGVSQSNLSIVISNLESERNDPINHNNSVRNKASTQKMLEAEILRDEIAANLNRLFEINVVSTIFADSMEELDAASDLLGQEMSKNLATIRSVWAQQKEALKSNIPMGKDLINMNNTFDTYAAASVFPFITSDISQPTGIPMGVNKQTGLPVLLDTFSFSLPNCNMVILGKNASGKRSAVKILISRSSVLSQAQSIIIDSLGKYRTFTDSFCGINIDLGSSKVTINPFDIEPETVRDSITGRERITVNLESKIDDVTGILMTMARGSIRSQYPNDITRTIIKTVAAEEYKDAGITSSPDSIYESSGANLIGTKIARIKKEMPTIGSWYKRLCEKSKENTNSDYKYHYEFLIKYMKDFVREQGGKIPYFDGQTNYTLPSEVQFINFDLSSTDETFLKPLTQQVLSMWLWEKYIKTNSEDKSKAYRKHLIIDEARFMVPYHEATNALNTLADRSARRNVSLVIVSEQFNEFLNNQKMVKTMASAGMKLFFRQNERELLPLKESFKLTDGEINFLYTSTKGEGVLQVSSNSAQIYIAPTGYEIELIEGNPDSLMTLGGLSAGE